ncbi:MAG: DinB family protein [Chloroflexi bacterium]|nr:DinB family protein [Chloroflexota bacterium]
MTRSLSSLARKLLRSLERNHSQLLAASGSDAAAGLADLRRSLLTLLEAAPAESLVRQPNPGEWSALEVLSHLVEHDGKREELATRGIAHYVEHGQGHLEQARRALAGR